MDREKRLQIIYRIGDITENHCQNCEFHSQNKAIHCGTNCDYGKELKQLGTHLQGKRKDIDFFKKKGAKNKMSKINQTEFEQQLASGKSMKEIAEHFNVPAQNINYYKKKFAETHSEPSKTEESMDYKERAEQLEEVIQQMAEEQENLTAACEDLEEEVSKYKKVNENYEKHIENMSNQSNRFQQSKVEQENKELKEQVNLLKNVVKSFSKVVGSWEELMK